MILKKIIFLILFGGVLVSCVDGEDTLEDENLIPSAPQLVYPSDNLLCIENVLEFKWNPTTDGNADGVTYQVDVAEDNQFTSIAHTARPSTTTQTFTLKKGTAYYWRVRSIDNRNASSTYSPTFKFYTQGEAISNHLPFAPELVSPSQEVLENSEDILLQWKASDMDNDALVFDVYFGTENPPIKKIAENHDKTSFGVSTMAATEYYWKIVVKDDQGGTTLGPIWNFRIE